jgi:hypothetical protein
MRFFVWARAILSGWATLLAIVYLVERPVLHWSASFIAGSWFATIQLAFDCAVLATAGWVTGRFNRSHAMLTALLFAVTLSFWDFGETLALNVPWLLRLVWNSFRDSRYLDSLAVSAETHVLLFGCLMAGAGLSRAREEMVSIVDS